MSNNLILFKDIDGIDFLHSNFVAHRDLLAPKNSLLSLVVFGTSVVPLIVELVFSAEAVWARSESQAGA
jgi:hypothetical protein